MVLELSSECGRAGLKLFRASRAIVWELAEALVQDSCRAGRKAHLPSKISKFYDLLNRSFLCMTISLSSILVLSGNSIRDGGIPRPKR